ncbi:metal ABC transporter solute-binding protein, Zn/Mn family [Sporosarcina sp. Te-1]|uniref:metal ABC transporter solute-binding protein, Zn/Mn family n=1 Tax=Sporosarcina sp. Te-1 TaxID=2818390 RepID=UPI001A9EEE9F|nr:zinc ABC transporter substrate-binding protein [Sporosarcina sp. Te-1]QTD42665.1 zinc ABC transporter substrate-binding protein [Sporosarcina sp. Te-1]
MKRLLFIGLILTLVLGACGKKDDKSETGADGKLSIYTTVYPLQYFAERIGGSHVNVHSIYPAGADEHTFEPTQKDMMKLADADVFFYIGLGLEGFVENAKKTLTNEKVQMIATAENISTEQLQAGHDHDDDHDEEDHDGEEHHDHGEFDPHVWISPQLSVELAKSIEEALANEAPEFQDEFKRNLDELVQDLNALDGRFQEMASNSPTKTFFVSHAAFGYIAKEYGLEQVAISGLNSQSEPSQKQLAHIVEQAKGKNVHYILFEQNVSSKLTEVIRKEIGAESLMLHNLGVLTPDDIKNKETYFTLMDRNIETLQKALSR